MSMFSFFNKSPSSSQVVEPAGTPEPVAEEVKSAFSFMSQASTVTDSGMSFLFAECTNLYHVSLFMDVGVEASDVGHGDTTGSGFSFLHSSASSEPTTSETENVSSFSFMSQSSADVVCVPFPSPFSDVDNLPVLSIHCCIRHL